MKIGDQVIRRPVGFYVQDDLGLAPVDPLEGVVVYIHPKGRFHTVAFPLPGGVVRECFHGTDPGAKCEGRSGRM